MRIRRHTEEFSLSFLDVICCGFGAVILLLMITKTVQPQIIEQSAARYEGRVAALREQDFELRGETATLNRELTAKREQLAIEQQRVAELQGRLADLQAKYGEADLSSAADALISGKLAVAAQELTEEMERLLARQSKSNYIGGIPVDSEYIIFVIDTSGSMFSHAWERVLEEFEAVLDIYPDVKGIQVMNDQGQYMFSRYRGKWIPDNRKRREVILARLSTWNAFSNSSPVEGIEQAIRVFHEPGKKISIYVFGDDFTGVSIEGVLDTVDRLNPEDESGNRLVRIHAVGFPVLFSQAPHLQTGGFRFATLMRELTQRNGGTFVGLNDFQ